MKYEYQLNGVKKLAMQTQYFVTEILRMGIIDEARISNIARTETELKEAMAKG